MRSIVGCLILAGACVLPLAAGCSRTISEKETVTRRPDGTTTVDRTTVKERPDGTIEREREVDVDRD